MDVLPGTGYVFYLREIADEVFREGLQLERCAGYSAARLFRRAVPLCRDVPLHRRKCADLKVRRRHRTSAFSASNSFLGVIWALPFGMVSVERMLFSISMGEEDRVHNIGIRLVYRIAKKIVYQNLLGCNVLTMEV